MPKILGSRRGWIISLVIILLALAALLAWANFARADCGFFTGQYLEVSDWYGTAGWYSCLPGEASFAAPHGAIVEVTDPTLIPCSDGNRIRVSYRGVEGLVWTSDLREISSNYEVIKTPRSMRGFNYPCSLSGATDIPAEELIKISKPRSIVTCRVLGSRTKIVYRGETSWVSSEDLKPPRPWWRWW